MIEAAFAIALIIVLDCSAAGIACAAAAKYRLRLRFFETRSALVLFGLTMLQLATWMRYTGSAGAVVTIIALGVGGICAVTDAQNGHVFDAVTVPALLSILAIGAATMNFQPSFLGAAASGIALGALYLATFGRGLGLGDVKLACCTGAALGVAGGLRSLQAAFVLGGLYAVALLLYRRARWGQSIGFAPFLFAGMVLTVLERG